MAQSGKGKYSQQDLSFLSNEKIPYMARKAT